jgi:hypothetical protein
LIKKKCNYCQIRIKEKCADDTAISITDYHCTGYISAARGSEISLTIENQGFFEVDGFFITASDYLERPPYQSLNATNAPPNTATGRYDFSPKLIPGNSTKVSFSYNRTGELKTLKRVKIQPYKSGTKALLACPYIAEIRPENCG